MVKQIPALNTIFDNNTMHPSPIFLIKSGLQAGPLKRLLVLPCVLIVRKKRFRKAVRNSMYAVKIHMGIV